MTGRSRNAVVALVLVLAGASVFASGAQAGSVTITLTGFQFTPSPVHLTRGDYVTWVNKDPVPAQVVPVAGGFTKSPLLQPGQRYTTRIIGSGTINYYESLSGFMRGTLIVANAPLPTATARPTMRPTAAPTPTPRPTPRPTPKPTAKPTAKATAAPAASAGSTAAASSGSPTDTASNQASSSATPVIAALGAVDETGTGGFGGLGAVLLGLVLVALAFVGGMFFMSRRSAGDEPPSPLPATSPGPPPGPSAPVAPTAPAPAVVPRPGYRPSVRPRTGTRAPIDFDDDAPLQSARKGPSRE